MDVAGFYDEYTRRQVQTGINERHCSIMRFLKRHGLRAGQSVFEIGCGIGTLTELLADELGSGGRLLATDLSPRSIELARTRLGRRPWVELIAGDAVTMRCEEQFDVIVLPDVVEHIPLDQHPALFAQIRNWIRDDGFVLLHYPNPHHLEWVRAHKPDALQIIDQPVHADLLTANAYSNGLYLTNYERYAIWHQPADYIVAVLQPASGVGTFTEIPQSGPSMRRRGVEKMKLLVGTRLGSTARDRRRPAENVGP